MSAEAPARPVGSPRRPGVKMALLAFCMLVFSVDYNIVYVALPEIGREVGFSAQSLQWVVSAYSVGLGGALLLGGRAVDRLGARRMLVLALALYALASTAGGLATEPGLLVAARVVQGLGGALLFPATLSLINTGFEEGPVRNRAYAVWGTAGASGAIIGSLVGGLLTDYLGWAWVFFVNVPLCVLAVAGCYAWLAPDARSGDSRAFDVHGALLATAASTLLVYGLINGPEAGWSSARTLTTIAVGLVLGVAFFAVEAKAADPLAPPRLFGYRGLLTAMLIIFVFQGAINTLHYLFFIQLQDVLGYSPLEAGLAFLPMSAVAMLGSGKLLPAVVKRWGVRGALFSGLTGVGASMIVLSLTMSTDTGFLPLLPAVLLWGLFAGMIYPAMFMAAGSDAAPDEQGVASGLTQTSAQIGGAVGMALLIAVANAGLDLNEGAANSVGDVVDGLRLSALTGGIAAVAGAFLAFRIKPPRAARQDGSATEAPPEPETVHSA
ncbi:MFS transporter [Streptomyces sp. JB150]|uniref:MFS transporter n=1 Tax=Streptomyces sp. JB150 TaxID=2714844 RepID=UPI001408F6D7|nr:MFS transporter [Streptomyces sp. JB150]QIJ65224.1 MFS transporter [Streptomyces sp. JB150]